MLDLVSGSMKSATSILLTVVVAVFCSTISCCAEDLEGRTFAELMAMQPTLSESEIEDLLKSNEAPQRRYAVLWRAESAPQSAASLRTLRTALADADIDVRNQAMAGLMRLRGPAPPQLLDWLTDFTNERLENYDSEAFNGGRTATTTISTIVLAALYGSKMEVADQILDRYRKDFAAPTQPDDFLHPNMASLDEARKYLVSNLMREIAIVYPKGPSAVPQEVNDTLAAISEDASAKALRHGRSLLASMRETSASMDAIRQRLLDAVALLAREPTAQLVAAISGADRPLTMAAMRAVDSADLASSEIDNALEIVLSRDDAGFRNQAARLLAKHDAGQKRLVRLLTHSAPAVRAAAMAALPNDTPGLAAHIQTFLASDNAEERIAAMQTLNAMSYRVCGYSSLPVPDLVKSVAEHNLAPIERILFQSEHEDEFSYAQRFISNVSCGLGEKGKNLATDLAIALPQASSERLNWIAGLLDNWGGSASLIDEIGAKQAVAKAMARAATTETDHRSVSDLVRVFVRLELSPSDAQSVFPEAAATVGAGTINYWIGRSEIVEAMKRHGVGDAFCDYVAERTPASHPAILDIYKALAGLSPKGEHFKSWRRMLVNESSWALVELASVDIATQEGSDEHLIERMISILRNSKLEYRSPAFEQLAALGSRGAKALMDLISDGALSNNRRAALIALAGRTADAAPVLKDIAVRYARSTDQPAAQAAALTALSELEDNPPELAELLLEAMHSLSPEVRRAALTTWAKKKLQGEQIFELAFADGDSEVLKAAISALLASPLPEQKKLTFMRAALARSEPEIRAAAFDVLPRMGAPGDALLVEIASAPGLLPDEFYSATRYYAFRSFPTALKAALERRASDASSPEAAAARKVLIGARIRALAHSEDNESLSLDGIEALRRELLDPDPELQAAAANKLVKVGADPWLDGGLVAAWLTAARVKETVEKRLGTVLDFLDPPGMSLTSGRIHNLPVFPWPPPAGYSAYSVPRQLLTGAHVSTFGDVYRALVSSLTAVSDNFEHGLFMGPPDGFAVVARLERVKVDGTPYPEPARWVKEGQPAIDLFDLLGNLFFSEPGYFRTIVFAITSDLNPGADMTQRLPEPAEGAEDMPADLAAKPFGDNLYTLALIYSFERRSGGKIAPWSDGAPSAQRHLVRAGIIDQLSNRTRRAN